MCDDTAYTAWLNSSGPSGVLMTCSENAGSGRDRQLAVAMIITMWMILVASPAAAQTYRVIHTFSGGYDGATPLSGLIIDRSGNLYGTASGGGKTNDGCETYGCGVAFRLKATNGTWTLSPLYIFQGGTQSGPDGSNPYARMVFGANGALYGTTAYGGGHRCNNITCGTVFKLTPPATACKSALCYWTETVLYRFSGPPQAGNPNYGPIVFDQAGNIYGVAGWGPSGYGAIYQLTESGGTWTENDLASADSAESGVVFDNADNLYGSNSGEGYGGVYQLMRSGTGWTLHQLYSIVDVSDDGYSTFGGVILDNAGNIYGSTLEEGQGDGGTIFELLAGTFHFDVLYNLSEGTGPEESLTMDAAGNLYGTTWGGGAHFWGNVFKLSPSASGWTYTDLYDFTDGNDGGHPISNVVIDAQGNLYGTTAYGGSGPCTSAYNGNGCGVVWEITPN